MMKGKSLLTKKTKKEFLDLLKKHDWYYSSSDDRRAYDAGKASQDKLRQMYTRYPELKAYYKEYETKVYHG